jgi:hypothetical protein
MIPLHVGAGKTGNKTCCGQNSGGRGLVVGEVRDVPIWDYPNQHFVTKFSLLRVALKGEVCFSRTYCIGIEVGEFFPCD